MAMQQGLRGPVSDINVTPMVDVVLVLLIIFMVAAPMIHQGVPVALPATKAQTLASEEQHAVLTLTRDRRVYLGEVEIPLAELKSRLQGNLKLQREQNLYLHADKSLPYGFVVETMAAVQAAGITNLGMVTEPVTTEPKKP